MNTEKNEGTALILGVVLGIFGVLGVGHIYAGELNRGVILLLVGFALLVGGFFTMGILAIAYIALFIWTIYDIRKISRRD